MILGDNDMSLWGDHVRVGTRIPNWNYSWVEEITRWTKPCKALELGAGTGKTAILLQMKGYDVTCLDNDPEVIEAMKKNISFYNAGCKPQLSDLAKIDGKYDLIYSCGVLEHISFEKITEAYM
jgi:tellurite methyltransferase